MGSFRRAVAAFVATAVTAGCSGSTLGVSRELDNGRTVGVTSTRLTRKLWVEPGFESTTARIGPRRVSVEPKRIEIDERLVATIDEATKSVQVNEIFDRLEIRADGETVYEGPF